MHGNVTALEGLHVTEKYRYSHMQHTCSKHAAWDPHRGWGSTFKIADFYQRHSSASRFLISEITGVPRS